MMIKMDNDILLSIVVTVFNSEKYLSKCLSSLISQTTQGLEFIIVDDGSSDSSSSICDKFASLDKRVKVIHKKNGGLVAARITGVWNSAGKYISFLDSDDWIEDDSYNKIVQLLDSEEYDLITTDITVDKGMESTKEDSNIPYGVYENESLDVVKESMLYKEPFYSYGIYPYLVTKIFNKNKLKEIYQKFPTNISIAEDAACTYSYILLCKKILIMNYSFYHYVKRMDSMSYSGKNYDEVYKSNFAIFRYLNKKFDNQTDSANLIRQLKYYMVYMTIGFCPNRLDQYCNQTLSFFGGVEKGSTILIYGAGNYGVHLYEYLKDIKDVRINGWIDKNYTFFKDCRFDIKSPECIKKMNYDYILLSIINLSLANQIKQELISRGISANKILTYANPDTIMKYIFNIYDNLLTCRN